MALKSHAFPSEDPPTNRFGFPLEKKNSKSNSERFLSSTSQDDEDVPAFVPHYNQSPSGSPLKSYPTAKSPGQVHNIFKMATKSHQTSVRALSLPPTPYPHKLARPHPNASPEPYSTPSPNYHQPAPGKSHSPKPSQAASWQGSLSPPKSLSPHPSFTPAEPLSFREVAGPLSQGSRSGVYEESTSNEQYQFQYGSMRGLQGAVRSGTLDQKQPLAGLRLGTLETGEARRRSGASAASPNPADQEVIRAHSPILHVVPLHGYWVCGYVNMLQVKESRWSSASQIVHSRTQLWFESMQLTDTGG